MFARRFYQSIWAAQIMPAHPVMGHAGSVAHAQSTQEPGFFFVRYSPAKTSSSGVG